MQGSEPGAVRLGDELGAVADTDGEFDTAPAQRLEGAGMAYEVVWHWLLGWLYRGVAGGED